MAAATLTGKGQVVIPAGIRSRYGLTPGTQVEFIDDGDSIRLRKLPPSKPESGYGMVKLKSRGKPRRLADFDAAELTKKKTRP